MTKIKFTILGLVALFLTATILTSCSNDESINTEDQNLMLSKDITAENQTSLFSKKENAILKSNYGFKNISFYIDKSNSFKFVSLTTKAKVLNKHTNINTDGIDLTRITETVWKNNIKSYFIPYTNNPTKWLIILETANGILDFKNAIVFDNSVDSNGYGNINITTTEGSFIRNFKNGIEVNQSILSGRRTFRQCFDAAYDAVCDGFVGCVAWYTHPAIPVMAATMCQIEILSASGTHNAPELGEVPGSESEIIPIP